MAYQFRGIVEGFYGRPWTHDERLEMFGFMDEHGLNGYIYAPKDDELHRDQWRAPYTADALTQFRTLCAAAHDHGIRFTFAMSPGLDLRYGDPAELDALLAKLEPLLAIGVESIGVFFDDVPPALVDAGDQARYRGLGAAQADFLTRLHSRLPDVHLVTVPTFYCGEPDIPYLHDLAATPPAVDIMWTGPAICSRTLTQAHLQSVADVLKRPTLVWDNYPVNDAGMIAQMHLGPYRGRDADLPVRGIYANPMCMVQASKVPLATFAAHCAAPGQYDPDASWQAAARAAVGAALVQPLAIFAEAVTISPLTPEQPPAMLDLIAPFRANLLPYTDNPAPDHLRAGVARMRAAHRALMGGMEEVALLREIEPWLRDYGRWIDLLDAAQRLVDARLRHAEEAGTGAATMHLAREEIRQGLKDAVDFPTATCGDVLRNFLQELLRRTSTPPGSYSSA